jgi:hypothetical protein
MATDPTKIETSSAPAIRIATIVCIATTLPASTAERRGWATRVVFHIFSPCSSPNVVAASKAATIT